MSCRQCGNTVIPSTVVVSNLPQDGTMCDECNLKATTEPELVIAAIDAFTDHDQEAAMREEAMVIAGSEEEAGSAEPVPGVVTEPEFALDDGGGDDDGLSPDAYAGVQYADIEASGAAFNENDRSVARAVFAKFQSASEELNLSSCLKGGMGGSAAGEITAGSIAAVLDKLDVDNRDIFIDLWSGTGAVVAVGSELRGAKASVGVESDRNRAYISQVFLHKMTSQAQHAEGQHDSENSISFNACVVAAHMDALSFTNLQPGTKGYCFSAGMPPDVQDSVSRLMTSTTTMQRFIIFHPLGVARSLLSRFVLLDSGTARLLGSSTTRTWYMYGRKGGDDGDDDDDDDEEGANPVMLACAECNTNGELVACTHCSALCCSSHASVGKHKKNMCELSFLACEAENACAYLTAAIHDFGNLPARFSWASETTPSTERTLLDDAVAAKVKKDQEIKAHFENKAKVFDSSGLVTVADGGHGQKFYAVQGREVLYTAKTSYTVAHFASVKTAKTMYVFSVPAMSQDNTIVALEILKNSTKNGNHIVVVDVDKGKPILIPRLMELGGYCKKFEELALTETVPEDLLKECIDVVKSCPTMHKSSLSSDNSDGNADRQDLHELADCLAEGMAALRRRGDRNGARCDEETPISPESATEFLTAEGVLKLLQSKRSKEVFDEVLKREKVVTKPMLGAAVESLPVVKMMRDDTAVVRSKVEAVSDNSKELKKEVAALGKQVTKLVNDKKAEKTALRKEDVAAMIAAAFGNSNKRSMGERSPEGQNIGSRTKSSKGKGKSARKQSTGDGDDDDESIAGKEKVERNLERRMEEVDNGTTSSGATVALQAAGPVYFQFQNMMAANVIQGGTQTISNAGSFAGLQLPTAGPVFQSMHSNETKK